MEKVVIYKMTWWENYIILKLEINSHMKGRFSYCLNQMAILSFLQQNVFQCLRIIWLMERLNRKTEGQHLLELYDLQWQSYDSNLICNRIVSIWYRLVFIWLCEGTYWSQRMKEVWVLNQLGPFHTNFFSSFVHTCGVCLKLSALLITVHEWRRHPPSSC